MGDILIDLAILGVVTGAALIDLRSRRIPNRLTLPAALAGLALRSLLFGGLGLATGAAGLGLALALFLPLFLVRGMGAGDVKLMAALGALAGPEFVFFTGLWASVFGGVFAVAGLLRSRRFSLALRHLALFKIFPRPDQTFISAGRIPYAPAIALGAILTLGGVRWLQG